MNSTRRWTLHAACAFLVSCATPGPPPRARVAVELLQGFPASTLVPALTSGAREEHVILLIDATASMQRTDDTSPESNALAASSAASRLIGSLGQERSVDVWTLGASEADCAPAWRGMPFEDPERAARAGEGSLADALVRIAAGLEDARFDWQTGVEAKSRRRPGVLHEKGTFAASSDARGIEKLLRKAQKQKPEGMPLLIFIDVNLPPAPGAPPEEKSWVVDARKMFDRLGAPTPQSPDPFAAVFLTSFPHHYGWPDGKSYHGGEWERVLPRFSEHLVPSDLLRRIYETVRRYDTIPNDI